jgi:hypothetical protein
MWTPIRLFLAQKGVAPLENVALGHRSFHGEVEAGNAYDTSPYSFILSPSSAHSIDVPTLPAPLLRERVVSARPSDRKIEAHGRNLKRTAAG